MAIQAAEVFLWVGEDNSRVGAVVVFTLAKPVDFEGVMPMLDRCAAETDIRSKGYGVKPMQFSVGGLQTFHADVDLRSGRVVGFLVGDATGELEIAPAK